MPIDLDCYYTCIYNSCFLQFTRVRPLHLLDGRPNAVDNELLLIRRHELDQLLENAGATYKTCLMEYQLVVKYTGIDSCSVLAQKLLMFPMNLETTEYTFWKVILP